MSDPVEDEPTITDDELRWLAITARDCSCCPDCHERPCDGCAAGGVCDLICRCSGDYFDDDERDEEDIW